MLESLLFELVTNVDTQTVDQEHDIDEEARVHEICHDCPNCEDLLAGLLLVNQVECNVAKEQNEEFVESL